MKKMSGIKVLVVDDSMFFREVLSRGLMANLPAGSTIAKASNPFEARDQILSFDPDVMVLDVEMPKMNGIEFLRRLIVQYALPTIVLSSRPAYRGVAMEAGAYGFMPKPSTTDSVGFMKELAVNIKLAFDENARLIAQSKSGEGNPAPAEKDDDMPLSPLQRMLKSAKSSGASPVSGISAEMNTVVSSMKQLSDAAKGGAAYTRPVRVPANAPKPQKPVRLIAIGASTGGTEALSSVLRALPGDLPPIVIVQHIPPMFSRLFAERLNMECVLNVKEAQNGDRLERGWVYIAPGDQQMTVKKMGDLMSLECFYGDKVNGHCPSVDVLFSSVASRIGNSAMGVILTGMGDDGARGMLKMRQAGSVTLGQDEASSVVYGMPRAAFEMGAVSQQLPLSAMAAMITVVANYQGG